MLDLSLVIPTGHSRQAAEVARAKMSALQWAELVDFAAAVVLAQEQVATGRVILVAEVSREALALGGTRALAGAAPVR